MAVIRPSAVDLAVEPSAGRSLPAKVSRRLSQVALGIHARERDRELFVMQPVESRHEAARPCM
jgi:hypothetical protein